MGATQSKGSGREEFSEMREAIGVRAANVLIEAGIHTVEDVLSQTQNQILRLPGLGRTSLKRIIEWVSDYDTSGRWSKRPLVPRPDESLAFIRQDAQLANEISLLLIDMSKQLKRRALVVRDAPMRAALSGERQTEESRSSNRAHQ